MTKWLCGFTMRLFGVTYNYCLCGLRYCHIFHMPYINCILWILTIFLCCRTYVLLCMMRMYNLTEQHMNQIFKIGILAYLNSVFWALFIANIGWFMFGSYHQLCKKKHINQLVSKMPWFLPVALIKTIFNHFSSCCIF